MVPWFGEFCSYCCLLLLPQLSATLLQSGAQFSAHSCWFEICAHIKATNNLSQERIHNGTWFMNQKGNCSWELRSRETNFPSRRSPDWQLFGVAAQRTVFRLGRDLPVDITFSPFHSDSESSYGVISLDSEAFSDNLVSRKRKTLFNDGATSFKPCSSKVLNVLES